MGMTLKDVIVCVLQSAGRPLTANEIIQDILLKNRYDFGSNHPRMMVDDTLRANCKGIRTPKHSPVDAFERFLDEKEHVRYKLLEPETPPAPPEESESPAAEPEESESPAAEPPKEESPAPTLQDAVIAVLKGAGRPMTMREIKQEILSRRLYALDPNPPMELSYHLKDHSKETDARDAGRVRLYARVPDANGIIRYKLFEAETPAAPEERESPVAEPEENEPPAAEPEEEIFAQTIKDAVVTVLRDAGRPMTLKEITDEVLARGLYAFKSVSPSNMIGNTIGKYCKDVIRQDHRPVSLFERVTDEDGRTCYKLLDAETSPAPLLEMAEPPAEQEETPPAADPRWLPILAEKFPDGYEPGDALCRMQAAWFWEERYDEACPLSDEAIDGAMRAVGQAKAGRVFAKSEEEQRLIEAICGEVAEILTRYSTVYRECIYEKYRAQLAACSIHSERVMTELLLSAANGRFVSSYAAFVRPGQTAFLSRDCRQVLRERGGLTPLHDIQKALWFAPEKAVYGALCADGEIISDDNGAWLLSEHFPMTREDAGRVADVLQDRLQTQGFVARAELLPLLEKDLPSLGGNLSGLPDALVFKMTKYYLEDRFDFTRSTIAPKGEAVDFAARFRAFAAEREAFTLYELSAYAKELALSIYWEPLYDGGAVRVSETEFVHESRVHFDVDAVDRVLCDLCPGDYLSLYAVSPAMMVHLPPCGYAWNGYLLLSFVRSHSRAFRLLCNGLGKTGYYGAMVRRDSEELGDYSALVRRVLAEDGPWRTAEDALELLRARGYQAGRKLKNIDALCAGARQDMRERGG